jgi:hypothetical protein
MAEKRKSGGPGSRINKWKEIGRKEGIAIGRKDGIPIGITIEKNNQRRRNSR